MKAYTFVIIATLTFSALYGCKSEIVKPQTPTEIANNTQTPGDATTVNAEHLLGKWSIVKDSTWAQFIGPPSITVYRGTSNDYYDFRTDGKCYKQENGFYDTISYKVASDTSVIFGDPVAYIDGTTGKTMYQEPGSNVINPLTAHGAKIVFSYVSPGGPHYNAIYLRK